MKILLVPHAYLPGKVAGCEVYLHRVAKYLLSRGHQVRCLVLYKEPYMIDGVQCLKVEHEKRWQEANTMDFDWADVVITQLWGVPFAVNKCRQLDKKIIYVAHNTNQTTSFQHMGGRNAYVLYNSDQLRSFLKFKHPSFVLEPPVDYRDFELSKNGAFITLVNHCKDKGGELLGRIAKALPERLFLAVRGGYGEQVILDEPNIKYEPPGDIRDILQRSKIVIMPSLIETYGQVAIEAYAAGIPVIAHPTDGLKESMGAGGIFIDRDDTDGYVNKILTLLNNQAKYKAASKYARARARELDPTNRLDLFNEWLTSI